MINKNPFLHRLIKEKSEDVVHTSTYAKAQNPTAMGAASTESFSSRMEMERNRQNIRSYADSKIVSSTFSNAPRAKTYEPPENNVGFGGGADSSASIRSDNRASGTINTAGQSRFSSRTEMGANRGVGGTGVAGANSGFNRGPSRPQATTRPITPPVRKNPGISR